MDLLDFDAAPAAPAAPPGYAHGLVALVPERVHTPPSVRPVGAQDAFVSAESQASDDEFAEPVSAPPADASWGLHDLSAETRRDGVVANAFPVGAGAAGDAAEDSALSARDASGAGARDDLATSAAVYAESTPRVGTADASASDASSSGNATTAAGAEAQAEAYATTAANGADATDHDSDIEKGESRGRDDEAGVAAVIDPARVRVRRRSGRRRPRRRSGAPMNETVLFDQDEAERESDRASLSAALTDSDASSAFEEFVGASPVPPVPPIPPVPDEARRGSASPTTAASDTAELAAVSSFENVANASTESLADTAARAHSKRRASSLFRKKSKSPFPATRPDVFAALSRFADLETLLLLAQLNTASRAAATCDERWIPVCVALGVSDSAHGPVVPETVLQSGFLSSGYLTVVRVLNTVAPVFANPALCTTPRCAVACGAVARVLPALPHAAEIGEVVAEQQRALLDELDDAITRDDPALLKRTLETCLLFITGLEDLGFKREVVDKVVGPPPELAPTEDDALAPAFDAVAAQLVCQKYAIFKNEGVPRPLQRDMWARALDTNLGAIIVFLHGVLAAAEPREYATTVVAIHTAARALASNPSLAEEAEADARDSVAELVELQVLKPIVDEFCLRQREYIQARALAIVGEWKQSIAKRDSETEKLLWRQVPKKSDKKNFMSSFKWAFLKEDKPDEAEEEGDGLPRTEFEAQTAVLATKLRGMESLVSIEVAIEVLELCRAGMHRLRAVGRETRVACEDLYILFLDVVGRQHVQTAFVHAIKVLNAYNPKTHGRLVVNVRADEELGSRANSQEPDAGPVAVEPLAVFTELVNVGDLVQQMAHVFFQEELVATQLVRAGDFAARSAVAKRRFEQMLDEMLADGLSRGIDVLIDQVEFTLVTEQLGSDYLPLPTQEILVRPTAACERVISLVQAHLDMLAESTEKSLFDVFQEEVGMRLFTSLCKHIKKQTISVDGAITLIADVNAYYAFILTLKRRNVVPYYEALKRIAQLFLIDRKHAKQLASAMSDSARYQSLIPIDEIVEFVKRRQDWPLIKNKVEKLLYGFLSCTIC